MWTVGRRKDTLQVVGHTAAASAAGYLYQTNLALVELLRKADQRPDHAILLEFHDDIAWASAADVSDATHLLQVKLHEAASPSGLGDMAPDIWKTLRIWMARADLNDPFGPDLMLVTTSIAAADSAAFALRPPTRDQDIALDRLVAAARDSGNQQTADVRAAFLDLDPAVRSAFVGRIVVLDGQAGPGELDGLVRQALTFALPQTEAAQDRFVAQVWAWWAAVAVDMLAGRREAVAVTEVQAFVRELRDSYTTETLPTTVPLAAVTDDDVLQYEGSRFVTQLRMIDYASPALRSAVIDYHRAITQETHWLSDSLLGLHELRAFEDELRFEWQREFSTMVQDLELDHLSKDDAELVKRRAGRGLLNFLLNSTAVTVRAHYHEGFFARGKRHELAGHDEATRRIGWHPDFVQRLQDLADLL